MPAGNTTTYIRVVHGATRNPPSGHRNVSNAWFQRTWSTSHQTRMAARGPNAKRAARMQHIGSSLLLSRSAPTVHRVCTVRVVETWGYARLRQVQDPRVI